MDKKVGRRRKKVRQAGRRRMKVRQAGERGRQNQTWCHLLAKESSLRKWWTRTLSQRKKLNKSWSSGQCRNSCYFYWWINLLNYNFGMKYLYNLLLKLNLKFLMLCSCFKCSCFWTVIIFIIYLNMGNHNCVFKNALFNICQLTVSLSYV